MDNIAAWFVILVVILIVHLVEEIKTGFRKKLIIGEMPKSLFIGINALIYSFALAAFIMYLMNFRLGLLFIWIFTIGNIINGIGHIALMVIKRDYFPGGISAFSLLFVSLYLLYLLW
ncbi:MAG: HXXEE domain-containing protein [candidate division Zixibacteria bacterium]|nr:HXXEE domain-containing protein [candidate division Zixibacteria bacterium]